MPLGHLLAAGLVALQAATTLPATASPDDDDQVTPSAPVPAPAAARPMLKTNRWQEDWSPLADPALRTEPLDGLKYIGLAADDPKRYLSFGATLRERFESNDAAAFGTAGNRRDSDVLQRAQLHADLHVSDDLRVFTQLEDDRAWRKQTVSAVDQDRVDLRLAYVEYDRTLPAGTLKARIGRQDFAFDLQRFVSSRDGPNVRQSFDAAWADWETPQWRFIGFVSRPVQYEDDHAFDDRSNTDFRFSTLRVEHHVLGGNELSAYYALYQRSNARYGDAAGPERRHILDGRFAGASGDVDWDIEAMIQAGSVGATAIRAWAFGPRIGLTLPAVAGSPRLGVQVDVASGDAHHGDGRVGTFNPLFPNGYYFTLAGDTGDANLVQLKPSLTFKPGERLAVMLASGLLWRQTAADSVYVQPNVAVADTAGHGGRWTGSYEQLRTDYAVTRHLATAIEAVHYQVGNAVRSAGGHDSTYVGVELKALW